MRELVSVLVAAGNNSTIHQKLLGAIADFGQRGLLGIDVSI